MTPEHRARHSPEYHQVWPQEHKTVSFQEIIDRQDPEFWERPREGLSWLWEVPECRTQSSRVPAKAYGVPSLLPREEGRVAGFFLKQEAELELRLRVLRGPKGNFNESWLETAPQAEQFSWRLSGKRCRSSFLSQSLFTAQQQPERERERI